MSEALTTWQPISSAPKDGTRILLWSGLDGALTGFWDDQKYLAFPKPYWRTISWRGVKRDKAFQPTHWMPLPEAPL